MSAGKALPPLLTSYLQLPEDLSLSLITGVLGASPNWLVERYILAALSEGAPKENHGTGAGQDAFEVAVVLVSWMRDWNTWRTELRRTSVSLCRRKNRADKFWFLKSPLPRHVQARWICYNMLSLVKAVDCQLGPRYYEAGIAKAFGVCGRLNRPLYGFEDSLQSLRNI